MMEMKEERQVVKRLIRIMLYGEAAAWIGFGIAAALGSIPGLPAKGLASTLMAALALSAAAALLALHSLSERTPLANTLLIGLVVLIAVLSITDQLGILDWISLAFNLALLALLVFDRRSRPG